MVNSVGVNIFVYQWSQGHLLSENFYEVFNSHKQYMMFIRVRYSPSYGSICAHKAAHICIIIVEQL